MPSLKSVQKSLRMAYRELNSWRKVGARFNISPAMAFRMAERDYEPKTHTIRHKLELPSLVEVAPCKKCGELHLPKYCRNGTAPARKRTPPIRIGEATDEELEAIKTYLTPDQRRKILVNTALAVKRYGYDAIKEGKR